MTPAHDLRYALRQLRQQPGLTLIVVSTLALCIGANTAVYSVLDAVLLRPLPYPEPSRLAMVVTADLTHVDNVDTSQTGALFLAVRDATPGLDAAAYSRQGGVNFVAGPRASYVQQQRVSAGFFRVLGVAPEAGREFTRAEDTPTGPAVVVLSFEFWQHWLRGNRGILGQFVRLRGEPYRVVGIMPKGFRAPSEPSFSDPSKPPVDLWTPLRPTVDGEGSGSNYGVIARLKPGVSWPEATGQLQALSRALMQMPKFPHDFRFFEERIQPLASELTADVRRELLATWAAVLAVLLIGCVNIAGLLMARAPARAREIATRVALGASRGAIVRQLLAESLILALTGCAAGILLGGFAVDWLKSLGASSFETAQPIQLDWRVMAAMLAISAGASVLFGLAPAIQVSRLDIRSALAESSRGVARRSGATRGILIASEVALSLALLVSAGLLLRTLGYFHGLPPGFDARNLIVAESSLLDARYADRDSILRLYSEGLARISAIPGVRSAAVALTLPYERPLNYGFQQLDGFHGPAPEPRTTEMVYVTPKYFETLGIPLLAGRAFRASDSPESARVVVVSASFAKRFYGGPSAAIGRHLSFNKQVSEIAGVAGDVQQHSGFDGTRPLSIEPTVYAPMAQTSPGFLYAIHRWFTPKWVARSNASPASLAPKIQAAVATVDAELPLSQFRSMQEMQGLYLQRQRYVSALFFALAGLALALAAVGLYGLISDGIAQRTRELGIRVALGASSGKIITASARPGILLTLAGVAAGALLARVAGRLIASMLWGVRPGDPLTLAAAAALLLIVAAAACLIPCLRILRLDPAQTLRSE